MNALVLLEITAVLIAAALPGWALVRRFARPWDALAVGGALGVTAHAALLARVPALMGWPTVVADLVVAALLFPKRQPRLRRPEPLAFLAWLGVTISFVALALLHGVPRGWDPSFHSLLIDRIVTTGALPATWEPWEPVRINYVLGLQALVAHVARVTGAPPHVAFQGCFPFAYALLVGAAARVVRRDRAAFAIVALGGASAAIRLVYHWGGLPTVLGLAISVAALQAFLRLRGRASWVVPGLLLGSLAHFHHLTALIALSTACVACAASRSSRGARAIGLAILVALPTAPAALAATGTTGATSIFRFGDEPQILPFEYATKWGRVLLPLALFGLAARRTRTHVPHVVLAWLVFATVFLDVIYRAWARSHWNEDVSALTPSRWFQFASLPLAFFAAEAAALIAQRLPRTLVLAVLVGSCVPGAIWEYRARSVGPDLLELGAWAQARLPENALVVVRARSPIEKDPRLLPARYWWPYLLRRETDETPLPASEPRRDPLVLEKRVMAFDPGAARAIARRRGKRLFWLRPEWFPAVTGAHVVGTYESSGQRFVLDEDG